MKKNKAQLNKECVMRLNHINKSYTTKNRKIKVLNDVSFEFYNNNVYAIMGHSGSGKSTLINILGLIDSFDNGEYELYGTNISNFNDKELSHLRMKNIGFIFQSFYLNPTLKSYENVMVPMLINKEINSKDRKKEQ